MGLPNSGYRQAQTSAGRSERGRDELLHVDVEFLLRLFAFDSGLQAGDDGEEGFVAMLHLPVVVLSKKVTWLSG